MRTASAYPGMGPDPTAVFPDMACLKSPTVSFKMAFWEEVSLGFWRFLSAILA